MKGLNALAFAAALAFASAAQAQDLRFSVTPYLWLPTFEGDFRFNVPPTDPAGPEFNPDFNIGQVGIITRWTPVKNLTFSADLTWAHLDQKYAGVWNAAQNSGSAKPGGAVYEIKDQDSVTLLLRAQRNW